MLRQSLLFLSQSRFLRQWMERSGSAQKVTSRFVAGQNLTDGLRALESIKSERMHATMDFLGENVTSLAEAEISRDIYLDVLQQVHVYGASVSLKPTQFGLGFSADACYENVGPLVARARHLSSRVEIDMESSDYTDRTLDLVMGLQEQYGGPLRVALQAYLFRTEEDARRLSRARIPIRLCKGAYQESAGIAFPKKADVDRNYIKVMRLLLNEGAYPAIATHDEAMIRAAVAHVTEQKIAPERFEFQMLYGIRRDLQRQLVEQGYRLRLYVPYGDAWYPYFMRRLAERPANLVFLLKNLARN